MGSTLLSELATEILVPVCAVVGIIFSLVQWFIVSRVRLTHERPPSSNSDKKNGFNDYLIEEEEGINDQSVVAKCADIQSAISEGELPPLCSSAVFSQISRFWFQIWWPFCNFICLKCTAACLFFEVMSMEKPLGRQENARKLTFFGI